jgi:hypothetical protein
MVLTLVAGAFLAPAACGGKSGAPADASSTDLAVDMGGSPDAGATPCSLAAQDCPSSAEKCDFGCLGTELVVACTRSTDGGAIGTACSAAAPCARGGGCLTAVDAGAACRKYCASDGDCATGERCHNVSVALTCSGTSTTMLLHYCY